MVASPRNAYALPEQQCEFCGAYIKWATLLPSRTKIPIDSEPRANDDLSLKLVHRVNVRESFDTIGNASAVRYVADVDRCNHPRLYAPHKTTCVHADLWSGKRKIPRIDKQSFAYQQSMKARFEIECQQAFDWQMAKDDA